MVAVSGPIMTDGSFTTVGKLPGCFAWTCSCGTSNNAQQMECRKCNKKTNRRCSLHGGGKWAPWGDPKHPRHAPSPLQQPSQRSAAQQKTIDDRTGAKVAKLEKEARDAKAELDKVKKAAKADRTGTGNVGKPGQDTSLSNNAQTDDAADTDDENMLSEFKVLENNFGDLRTTTRRSLTNSFTSSKSRNEDRNG